MESNHFFFLWIHSISPFIPAMVFVIRSMVSKALGVSPHALDIPDIDSNIGLMHTFFALEDLRGLKIDKIDGELCIRLDKENGNIYDEMLQMFSA